VCWTATRQPLNPTPDTLNSNPHPKKSKSETRNPNTGSTHRRAGRHSSLNLTTHMATWNLVIKSEDRFPLIVPGMVTFSSTLERKQLPPRQLHSPHVRFVGPASGRGSSKRCHALLGCPGNQVRCSHLRDPESATLDQVRLTGGEGDVPTLVPSFRALSGRLTFTVRRDTFNKYSLLDQVRLTGRQGGLLP